jgi:hypothetical protein
MTGQPPTPFLTVPLLALLLATSARGVPEIVSGPWCGAVTPGSIAVTAHLGEPGVQARLVVSTAADFSNPLVSPPVLSAAASGNNVRLDLGGLAPQTAYFYAVELDGILQTAPARTGRFRTLPAPGPSSFRFGFSACGDWEEPGQFVHRTILTEDLDFFIHMGDFNYRDTDEDNPLPYRSNYIDSLVQSPELADLLRQLPTAYIWDDHDFSGNTSDRTSDGRSAHRQVYREMVPHYPLPAGGPDAAIQQTFQCGRVRFILSDLRSERDPDSWTDNQNKSMMGAAQKQWFKNQLVAARDAETPLIVWMSGLPFLSSSSLRDNWGSYRTERTELLEFIRDEDIRNIVIISGDMHALAYDDGRVTESYVAGVRIPIFHAASLTRNGSEKGGPYSGGVSEGSGRYGILEISDDGSQVSATYLGRIASSATAASTWKSHTHLAEPIRPRPASGVTAAARLDRIEVRWTDESGIETGSRIERRDAGGTVWSPRHGRCRRDGISGCHGHRNRRLRLPRDHPERHGRFPALSHRLRHRLRPLPELEDPAPCRSRRARRWRSRRRRLEQRGRVLFRHRSRSARPLRMGGRPRCGNRRHRGGLPDQHGADLSGRTQPRPRELDAGFRPRRGRRQCHDLDRRRPGRPARSRSPALLPDRGDGKPLTSLEGHPQNPVVRSEVKPCALLAESHVRGRPPTEDPP